MKLTAAAFRAMKNHCLLTDEEVCGFCLGKGGVVTQVREARNAAPAHLRGAMFILSPEDSLWLARQRIAKKPILAVYHSHPGISAEASAVDKAGLRFGDITYLIYSGIDDELKAWRRHAGTLVEEDVEVEG